MCQAGRPSVNFDDLVTVTNDHEGTDCPVSHIMS